jgi:hypothetical protein
MEMRVRAREQSRVRPLHSACTQFVSNYTSAYTALHLGDRLTKKLEVWTHASQSPCSVSQGRIRKYTSN